MHLSSGDLKTIYMVSLHLTLSLQLSCVCVRERDLGELKSYRGTVFSYRAEERWAQTDLAVRAGSFLTMVAVVEKVVGPGRDSVGAQREGNGHVGTHSAKVEKGPR